MARQTKAERAAAETSAREARLREDLAWLESRPAVVSRHEATCEGRVEDVEIPSLAPQWVLRSEETVAGWLVYAFHLATGTKVPPNPRPTRFPDAERKVILAWHERLAAEDAAAHAAWLEKLKAEKMCPTCCRFYEGASR